MTAPNFLASLLGPASTLTAPALPPTFQDVPPVAPDATSALPHTTDPIELAKQQMRLFGITGTQRALGNRGLLSDALYHYVSPGDYAGHEAQLAKALGHAFFAPAVPIPDESPMYGHPARLDAWRLYLGLPQKYGNFGVSDYRPSNAQTDATYFKLNNYRLPIDANKPAEVADLVKSIREAPHGRLPAYDSKNDVMANYQLTEGKDQRGSYIAYYDVWDLDVPGSKLGGHPYEIYDRIYYDPKTYKILSDKQGKP